MTLLIKPVLCYCSLSQTHKVDHIECRCDGWERFRAGQVAKWSLWPRDCKDEDGYPLCRYCGKIRFKSWLVQCPYCDKFFKGPTIWVGKKFHYECEDCG